MIHHVVPVIENVRVAERTFRLRVADREIATRILPGQFVMIRMPTELDPLLGRPFALYDTYLGDDGQPAGYDLVYLVVGKMTDRMSRLVAGESVEIWGPQGNGFETRPTRHLGLVAGGIGQTPFPAVARSHLGARVYGLAHDPVPHGVDASAVPSAMLSHRSSVMASAVVKRVTLFYGARSAAYLAGLDDFRAIGVDPRIATDDGSAGRRGFVTDLVTESLAGDDPPTRLLGCGPEPMMQALARLAERSAVPCELSLETPMACGIGACFSCVAKIRDSAGGWDYRRVCVEGPVFDAASVVF